MLLTQLIFAVAGGLKYVASGVHMAVEWATDSKADSLIEKHLLFTKETQHGRSIFTDRLMEWVNHDLRKFCGKTWYPGKEEKIIRTALLLREKVKVRERAAFCVAERGEAERQTYLLGASKPRATDCFVSGLYWFLNRLIWKLGSGLRYSSDALVDKSELRSFSDRSTLNPQCVNMLTVAAEGLTKAALTYDYEPEARKSAARPGEGKMLPRIAATSAKLDSEYEFECLRVETTDPIKMQVEKRGTTLLFNKARYLSSIEELRDVGVKCVPTRDEVKAMAKLPAAEARSKLAVALSLARTERFRTHPPVRPPRPPAASLATYPRMPRGEGTVDVVDHPLISLVATGMPAVPRVFFKKASAGAPAPAEAPAPSLDEDIFALLTV